MNFYRRFPGDYAADTQHLSTFQHGCYTLLLDHLYSTEKPIASLEDARRIARTTNGVQRCQLQSVLDQYFVIRENGYWHKRVDEELKHAELRKSKAKLAAESLWKNHARSIPPSNAPPDAPPMPSQTPDARQKIKTPLPPASAGGHVIHIERYHELVAVEMGRRKRLPNLNGTAGANAKDLAAYLTRNGFPAHVVQK
jgi:uncharacterized protein YdaU (DUF1376 family)